MSPLVLSPAPDAHQNQGSADRFLLPPGSGACQEQPGPSVALLPAADLEAWQEQRGLAGDLLIAMQRSRMGVPHAREAMAIAAQQDNMVLGKGGDMVLGKGGDMVLGKVDGMQKGENRDENEGMQEETQDDGSSAPTECEMLCTGESPSLGTGNASGASGASGACGGKSEQRRVFVPSVLSFTPHSRTLQLDKAYSRDFFQRGRIRVQIKKPDNTPHNPDIPNKMALMLKLGELIPKHVGRSKKDKEKDKEGGGGGGGGAGGSHGAGGSEKKGKGGKKRR
ncbi:unnamed protein product [Closterium sp. NIES-64]|nr:unnamed protein product [Closterium sp. NIES-64]CAI5973387.1 unnamed protein product [Closterium sp. NIES-64]CAI6003318.1 unnamed protein product [Closterium sp. NIES-64]